VCGLPRHFSDRGTFCNAPTGGAAATAPVGYGMETNTAFANLDALCSRPINFKPGVLCTDLKKGGDDEAVPAHDDPVMNARMVKVLSAGDQLAKVARGEAVAAGATGPAADVVELARMINGQCYKDASSVDVREIAKCVCVFPQEVQDVADEVLGPALARIDNTKDLKDSKKALLEFFNDFQVDNVPLQDGGTGKLKPFEGKLDEDCVEKLVTQYSTHAVQSGRCVFKSADEAYSLVCSIVAKMDTKVQNAIKSKGAEYLLEPSLLRRMLCQEDLGTPGGAGAAAAPVWIGVAGTDHTAATATAVTRLALVAGTAVPQAELTDPQMNTGSHKPYLKIVMQHSLRIFKQRVMYARIVHLLQKTDPSTPETVGEESEKKGEKSATGAAAAEAKKGYSNMQIGSGIAVALACVLVGLGLYTGSLQQLLGFGEAR